MLPPFVRGVAGDLTAFIKHSMTIKKNGSERYLKRNFPEVKKYAFAVISLFIALIIIYSNSFNGQWHYDDYANIVNNTNVHLKTLSWENINKTFYGISIRGKRISRPVSYLTFGLNYYFGKTSVPGFHIVNFIIHFVSSVFLFLFVYRILRLPLLKPSYGSGAYHIALLSAFLWATHPVHVTAVTYIVQRIASLAAMFYIMSMYFYLRARTAAGHGKQAAYGAICISTAILAFACKENTAMLPVSILLFDLFLIKGANHLTLKRSLKTAVIPVLIFFMIAFLYIDMSSVLNGYRNRSFTLFERLLTEPRIILFYISLLFYPLPSRMTLLHDVHISKSFFTPWTTLPAIFTIIFLVGMSLYLLKRKPLIAYCVLFFFINHIIEGTVIPLELVYEHRNYLPSMLVFVPVAIFFIHVCDYFSYRRFIRFSVCLGMIFVMAGHSHTTYARNQLFFDDLILWKDNAAKAPNLSTVHINFGRSLWNRGFTEEGNKEFKKAFALNTYNNKKQKGSVFYNLGLYQSYVIKNHHLSLEYFNKAIKISSGSPEIWLETARAHQLVGNTNKALWHLKKALAYWPDNSALHSYFSIVLFKCGKTEMAFQEALTARKLNSAGTLPRWPLTVIAEANKKKNDVEKSIKSWKDYTD